MFIKSGLETQKHAFFAKQVNGNFTSGGRKFIFLIYLINGSLRAVPRGEGGDLWIHYYIITQTVINIQKDILIALKCSLHMTRLRKENMSLV